ncbi:preprotein translocase subunit SecE [Carnobacterium pleistocenium]|uniref:preprotein translocase subunit SecE n=1 Tax=Carnobacterium pleistocenium TaxID=181073 RepID=UPI00054DF632|nr:preprotein translocase subunit SecE [Carnobacterium pleistocenium]
MKKIKNFFSGVLQQIKAVTWPTGKELRKYTLTVFVVCLLFVLFFMVVDFGIDTILDFIL